MTRNTKHTVSAGQYEARDIRRGKTQVRFTMNDDPRWPTTVRIRESMGGYAVSTDTGRVAWFYWPSELTEYVARRFFTFDPIATGVLPAAYEAAVAIVQPLAYPHPGQFRRLTSSIPTSPEGTE